MGKTIIKYPINNFFWVGNMINDFDLLTTCDISGFLKEEIRSIIIYKSDVNDSDIVLDINCGVGEISSEFSNLAQKVYAIDESPQAITISENNIKKHGNIDNVELMNENDLSAIEKIVCLIISLRVNWER